MSILVHELLSDNLTRTSGNTLLKERNMCITHSELENRSNQFSNYLFELGVNKGDRIALLMDASIDAVIAIVGIMKIGAIYVPINVSCSKEKIDYILNETESKIFIAESKYLNGLLANSSLNKIKTIIRGNEEKGFEFYRFSDYLTFSREQLKRNKIISKDIVNIIFTSGTTGTPKGVMVRHENITPFMNYVTKRFNHNELTRTLGKTPLSFDPFLTEIVPSFISGGFVYLYNNLISINHFLKVLHEEKITNFGCGPSLLLLLVENKELLRKYDLSNMQQIYFGYENCPLNTIRTLQTYLPQVTFINGYGTTETYASSTFHEINYPIPDDMESLPIGEPIEGTELLILNEEFSLTKPDEIGEMVIRGNSVMSGYWKNPKTTDEVLRVNPLFPESMEKVYFTGDLVKRNSNGDILFIGRKDTQIKIQGYRVELLEVQGFIESHPLVKECCVIVIEQKGTKKMVCYLVTKENVLTELDEIKSNLISNLEPYKFPHEWKLISHIPRNANSKVDRKILENMYRKEIHSEHNII
ncbi:AMP-binding protein [Bacillus atrophaeus]|uniref:AMP-binding protein n=1 Tax=Bacillus atrophaeus TaxID=1452 RepID=UPI0022803866|nr:AMP-binding protein [Bacillus atrophaeus]MCY8490940.1 AMP-binding protein [Bacillus atrophaeus]MCY8817820.1 AMP-binding protein [Bacillus atrophaeus]